jgi:hypothetical protein
MRRQYVPMEPCPNLDVKDFEHFSRSTPFDESAVSFKTPNDFFASLSGPKIHLLAFDWVVLSRSRVGVEEVLNLRHQDLSGCIQSLGDRVVERVFKSFLLAVHRRKKIGLVEVVRLGGCFVSRNER